MATRVIGAAILGLVFGFAGAQLLHLQWATLIPWGLGALGVGAVCRLRNEALVAGAVYGFILGLTFMIANYNGTDPVAGKLPFFVLVGVVCAAFGAVAAFVGWWRWHQMGGRAS